MKKFLTLGALSFVLVGSINAATLVEDFESTTWPVSPWVAASGGGGSTSTAAAHDGSRGFIDSGQTETGLTYQGFLEGVDRHLSDKVDVVMEKELPELSRESTLTEMIQSLVKGEYECLPVLDDKRVVGLVYVTEVFKVVARLALTPGQEGISLDH